MSGQLLLLLLTSVLASDDTSLQSRRSAEDQCVSQTEMFSAAFAENSKSKRKALQQLTENQQALMKHVELADSWIFWLDAANPDERVKKDLSSEEWLTSLKRMDAFRSYGQFLTQVKTLDKHVPDRIYLFKSDIRPVWEDEANKDGGKLVICLPNENDKQSAFQAFLKVAVKVMCSSLGNRVCGATFTCRPEGTTIAVWTPNVWTPQNDKEDFNRFKRLIYEEESLKGPMKIIFRPHKTASASRSYQPPAARRSYRNGPVRPPPGFEGSALSSLWFNNPADGVAPQPSLQQSNADQIKEAEALKLQKEAEERKKAEEERKMLLAKAEEEAKAKKLARRQRQKENRKKRKQGGPRDSSDDDESSGSSSEDEDATEVPMKEDAPVEVSVPLMHVVEEPATVSPLPTSSGYSKFFLPAVAALSTAALAAAPFVFQLF